MAHEIWIKRVYEPAGPEDGRRVLVDRLWPRGLRKEAAAIDEWMKELAPSDGLRTWFGHDPAKFAEFARRYREELAVDEQRSRLVDEMLAMAEEGTLTLLYAAKNEAHNNAVVLKAVLEEHTGRKS